MLTAKAARLGSWKAKIRNRYKERQWKMRAQIFRIDTLVGWRVMQGVEKMRKNLGVKSTFDLYCSC